MAGERVSWVWRYHQTSLRMIGSNCQNCKELHFPARVICPRCRHKQELPERHGVMKEKPERIPAKQ